MSLDQAAYCADEDLLVEAEGDYPRLVPSGQRYASGADGSFAAGSWVLASASTDFGAQGVPVGAAVFVSGAANSPAAASFGRSGMALVAVLAAGHNLTVRHYGLNPSEGDPPGGAAGLAAVSFRILSLRRQIQDATDEIRDELDVTDDPDADAIFTAADLRQLTVYRVLAKRYRSIARMASDKDEDWMKGQKYEALAKAKLKDLADRRWPSTTFDSLSVVPIDPP